MIGIIDYGLGNIKAFASVYYNLNIPAVIVNTPDGLKTSDKLILPGVGSFDHALRLLNTSGLRPVLDELVIDRRVPVLGICVGMQMLASRSDEGVLPGLGWIDGEVKRMNPSLSTHKAILPHMGWNDITPTRSSALFKDLGQNVLFYFLHSYYFHAHRQENVIAVTEYGGQFACAVNSENIFGVQFHPEKSHQDGIRLLKNFAEL